MHSTHSIKLNTHSVVQYTVAHMWHMHTPYGDYGASNHFITQSLGPRHCGTFPEPGLSLTHPCSALCNRVHNLEIVWLLETNSKQVLNLVHFLIYKQLTVPAYNRVHRGGPVAGHNGPQTSVHMPCGHVSTCITATIPEVSITSVG